MLLPSQLCLQNVLAEHVKKLRAKKTEDRDLKYDTRWRQLNASVRKYKARLTRIAELEVLKAERLQQRAEKPAKQPKEKKVKVEKPKAAKEPKATKAPKPAKA